MLSADQLLSSLRSSGGGAPAPVNSVVADMAALRASRTRGSPPLGAPPPPPAGDGADAGILDGAGGPERWATGVPRAPFGTPAAQLPAAAVQSPLLAALLQVLSLIHI